jgi:chromosome partitioning protein
MNVLTIASRKGGSGKSTLAAHLAAYVHRPSSPCLLIDDDPQGSLTFWNSLRGDRALPIKTIKRTLAHTLKKADRKGFAWVFIDTPANISMSVADAIQAATMLVIPCRPGVFDIVSVQDTIDLARRTRTPYAVVINAAPPRRADLEAVAVTHARDCLARLAAPVWGGQITHRADLSLSLTAGESTREYNADSQASAEIGRLWSAIERSVRTIRDARGVCDFHCLAA